MYTQHACERTSRRPTGKTIKAIPEQQSIAWTNTCTSATEGAETQSPLLRIRSVWLGQRSSSAFSRGGTSPKSLLHWPWPSLGAHWEGEDSAWGTAGHGSGIWGWQTSPLCRKQSQADPSSKEEAFTRQAGLKCFPGRSFSKAAAQLWGWRRLPQFLRLRV